MELDNACANYPLFLTGALQEILYLNPPPYLGNPPHILETVQGSQKIPPQGPKKWPTWPQKKAFLRHTHKKYILQKKWPKRAICGLSSGQNNLPPPIWGHGHQLDDRHRNPNNNTREIIWLGNQLCLPLIEGGSMCTYVQLWYLLSKWSVAEERVWDIYFLKILAWTEALYCYCVHMAI